MIGLKTMSSFTRNVLLTIAAIILVLCPMKTKAQGGSIYGQAISSTGKPIPFATVRVCAYAGGGGIPCTPLSSVFSDLALTQPVSNPYTSDQAGNFSVFVASGNAYIVQISGTGDNFSYLVTVGGIGGGTVSSVGLTAPSSILNVAGSPITGAGTFALTLANQTANTAFLGPATGSAAAPTFRSLVPADITPAGTLTNNTTGNAATATALQATTQCATGQAPTGIAANGTVENCTAYALSGSSVQQLLAGSGIGLSPSGGTGVVTVTNTGLTGLTTTGANGPSTVSAGVLNVPTYCGTGSAACFLLGGSNQTVTQSPTFGNVTPFTLCPTSSSANCTLNVNTPGGSSVPFVTFFNGGGVDFFSLTGGFSFLSASGFEFNVGSSLILSSDAFGTVSAQSASNNFPSFIVNPGIPDAGVAGFYFAACQHTLCAIGMTPEVADLQVTLEGVTEVKDAEGNAAVVCNNVDGCPVSLATTNQFNLCQAPFYASCTSASFGQKGFQTTTSGTTAAGTTVVVASAGDWVASSAGFSYGHEGIYIPGAGVSGAGYIGTVTSVSGTTLTVTPATSTSVASGTAVLHDETAAIQAAVAVTNYTTPTQVNCPAGVYNINGPFRDTGTFDSIIEMPTFSYNDSLNVNAPAQFILNGTTTLANFGGGVQGCTLRTDAVDTVNGGAGAVFAANGGSNGVAPIPISNISVTFSNVHLETNQNPQVSFINGTNFAAMLTDNVSLDTGVPTNCFYFEGDGCTTAFVTPTHTAQVGIATPGVSNIGLSIERNTSVTGQYTNMICKEHCYLDKVWLNWSVNCLQVNTTNYYGHGTLVNAEHCTNILVPPASGFGGITIDHLAVETSVPTSSVLANDPGSALFGWVNVQASGPYTINGAGNFDVYDLPTRTHIAVNHCDINQDTSTGDQVYSGQFAGTLQIGINRNPCTGNFQNLSKTTSNYLQQVGTSGSSSHAWATTSTVGVAPTVEMELHAGLSLGAAYAGIDPGDGNMLANQIEVNNSSNGGEQSYFGTFPGLVNFSYNRIPSTGVIPNTAESAAYVNISGTSSASSVSINVSPTANTQPVVEALFTPTGDTFSHTIAAPQLVGSGTAPTCTLGAASGSNSGSACASITGKNLAGRITITTGTATTASATLATITFGGTVTTAPQGCSLQPTNANAVGQNLMVFSNYPTTTGWTIGVGGTAVPASTTFTYSYSCF